jgi:hypothetical protein
MSEADTHSVLSARGTGTGRQLVRSSSPWSSSGGSHRGLHGQRSSTAGSGLNPRDLKTAEEKTEGTLRHVHNDVGRQVLEVESEQRRRKANDQHRT